MAQLTFSKMEGAGNDFILADNRRGKIAARIAVAKKLCDRKRSVGADGLILVETSKKADLRMRIFNPDGSEAEMCGNGVRCLGKYVVDQRIVKKNQFSVETPAGIIHVHVNKDIVKAQMIEPKELKTRFSIPLDGKSIELSYINTGVPHAVQIVSAVEGIDVDELGRKIRTHKYFAPRGTNSNFVAVDKKKNHIDIRTYERGVETETLACGTGSTAGALVASVLYGLKSPVSVKTSGGEFLKIYFSEREGKFEKVYLEGKIRKTFEGSVAL